MPKVIKATSSSSFVRAEVFPSLPKFVPIEFTLEFSNKGKEVISITSPKYPGILSEARTMKEAYRNAHDAILTYFEVPRACAKTITFNVVDEPITKQNVLLSKIGIKQAVNA